MAYWLYCLTCKQWSKSDTPLSDDKICTHCNSLFVQGKQLSRLNLDLDKITVEKLKNQEHTQEVNEASDLSNDVSERSDSTEEIFAQEKSNDISPPEKSNLVTKLESKNSLVKEESTRVNELLESPITPESNKIEELPEGNNTKEKSEKVELDRAVEKDERPPQEPLEATETESDNENEISETSESDDINEESGSNAQESNEVVEESDFSEQESDESQESQLDINTPDKPEFFEGNVTDDNREFSVEEEDAEVTKSESIPAHRIYMENKRRRKKHS